MPGFNGFIRSVGAGLASLMRGNPARVGDASAAEAAPAVLDSYRAADVERIELQPHTGTHPERWEQWLSRRAIAHATIIQGLQKDREVRRAIGRFRADIAVASLALENAGMPRRGMQRFFLRWALEEQLKREAPYPSNAEELLALVSSSIDRYLTALKPVADNHPLTLLELRVDDTEVVMIGAGVLCEILQEVQRGLHERMVSVQGEEDGGPQVGGNIGLVSIAGGSFGRGGAAFGGAHPAPASPDVARIGGIVDLGGASDDDASGAGRAVADVSPAGAPASVLAVGLGVFVGGALSGSLSVAPLFAPSSPVLR